VKTLPHASLWQPAIGVLLLLCILMSGCSTTRTPQTSRFHGGTVQDRVMFEDALEIAERELEEARPDITWITPARIMIVPTYPTGRTHEGYGVFRYEGAEVHAIAVRDEQVIFARPVSFRTVIHELKHIVAWGSGPVARYASVNHIDWMFPSYWRRQRSEEDLVLWVLEEMEVTP